MQRQQIIDKFVLFVEPEIFGYKTVYIVVTGMDIEENTRESDKLYGILRLAGEISEHHVCIGQINAFGLLVKENEVEKSIGLLENQIGQSLTILGMRESGRIFSNSKALIQTDYRLMHFLVKNPRAKVEGIAQATGITTKTVKRRLDKLVEDRIIAFRTVFRPEALRGYLVFYVLVNVKNRSSSKVLERIRSGYEKYLFSEPIIQPNIIFLNLFSENIYELDSVYRKIVKASSEVEKAWLFIDIDVRLFQDWLSNELERRLWKRR
jgi:DNA-binding Lrp family transcriptional regulator